MIDTFFSDKNTQTKNSDADKNYFKYKLHTIKDETNTNMLQKC